jgi:hypothetical protein
MQKIIQNNNKYSLGYFLLKLLILFAIVIILDYSIGNILGDLYLKRNDGEIYRTTYAIEKVKADLLVFGSSRANHHYQPSVFEKGLNLSCYNVGRDGNYIFYHFAVLKGVLARYSPKIAILDIMRGEFKNSQDDSYDRIASLLPYYRSHPEIRSIVELKSPYEKIKLLSSIYPYNSMILQLVFGNAEFNQKKAEKVAMNGYLPLTKTWNGPVKIDSSSSCYEIDSNKVKVYESFIQECVNSKIKLYVVSSPYLIKSNHTDYSITLGQEIAKKNNVLFFDYSTDTTFISNPKLFADIEHLNDEGAEIFSNMIFDKLNKTIE